MPCRIVCTINIVRINYYDCHGRPTVVMLIFVVGLIDVLQGLKDKNMTNGRMLVPFLCVLLLWTLFPYIIQWDQLLLAGDVASNPGPVRYPCSVCSRTVAKNHRAVNCDICTCWTHIKCASMTIADYNKRKQIDVFEFMCPKCLFKMLPYSDFDIEQDFLRQTVSVDPRNNIVSNEEALLIARRESPEGLSFCLANVRSLISKLEEVKCFLQDHKPDVFGITESWLDDSVTVGMIAIDGYNCERRDRGSGQGGGIVIYVSKTLRFVVTEDISSNINIEHLWLSIYPKKDFGMKLLFGVVYRPPNRGPFMPELEEILANIQTLAGPVVVAGDFNVDLSINTTFVRRFKELFDRYSYIQLVDGYTRITDTSKSCIDHLWVSKSDLVFGVTKSNGFSDHYMLTWISSFEVSKKEKESYIARNFKVFDEQRFISDLESQKWSNIELLDDIDDKVTMFNEILTSCLDKHAPLIKVNIKHMHKRAPWVTSDITLLIKEKNKAHVRALKSGHVTLWVEYRKQRNQLNHLLRDRKRKYFSELIEKESSDSRVLWRTINGLLGSKRPGKTVSPISGEDLNRHFVSVGGKIEVESERQFKLNLIATEQKTELVLGDVNGKVNIDRDKNIDGILDDCFFVLEPVNEESIVKIVMEIPDSVAMGCDGISSRILKLSISVIIKALTIIINESLVTGRVPTIWKKAIVTPIFKGGDQMDCNNYRPISVLPILSKILERIVAQQFQCYLKLYGLLNSCQSAYRKNHSTSTCLLKLTDDLRRAMDEGNLSVVVALDLSKAFDCLSHERLLCKLSAFGLSNSVLSWFKNYLSHRTQAVKTVHGLSEYEELTHGVPQGSVLGPLLFLLYVNDLPQVLSSCSIIQFADDTTLYVSGKSVNDIRERMNTDLRNISNWFCENGMMLNEKKTQCMVVGTRRCCLMKKADDLSLLLNDSRIYPVSNIKILGVVIDCHLNWGTHILGLCKNTLAKTKMLFMLRNFFGRKVLYVIYNSLIASQLNYCDVVWGNCGKGLQDKLQKTANLAARAIVFGRGPSSASAALRELNWLPLSEKRFLHLATLLWKCKNGEAPSYLLDRLCLSGNIHHYLTRKTTAGDLLVTHRRTVQASMSFTHMAPKVWNDMPTYVRQASTFDGFRRECYKWLNSKLSTSRV